MITNELISEIKSKINDNHKQAVTGGILQGVLVDMVKSLCEVYPQTYTDEEKAQARANIDALSNHNGEITKEKLSLEVQAILNDVANKQNISDATLATIAKTIVGAINEVYKGGLEDASIATSKIKDGAVTDAKIANGAVTTPKIANDAVTTEKVYDGAITEPKLDTDLVNIITSAVQPAELASAIATALASYVAKADIVDTTGSATDKVMSQHGVTEAIDGVTNKVTELEGYIPNLSGGEETLPIVVASRGQGKYISPSSGSIIAYNAYAISEPFELHTGDTISGIVQVSGAASLAKYSGNYEIGTILEVLAETKNFSYTATEDISVVVSGQKNTLSTVTIVRPITKAMAASATSVGDLENLNTIEKGTIVGAINELAGAGYKELSSLSVGAREVKAEIEGYFFEPVSTDGTNYGTYLDNKIDSVPQGDSFIFITDVHYSSNKKHSAPLIDYVRRRLGIKTIIHGGDVENENAVMANAAKQWLDFNEDFVFRIGTDFKQVCGDHDHNGKYASTGQAFSYQFVQRMMNGYNIHQLVYDTLYDAAIKTYGWTTAELKEYDAWKKMHYFFDDNTINTRFIVLHTGWSGDTGLIWDKIGNCNFLSLQMDFLYYALLTCREGYNVVVIGHDTIINSIVTIEGERRYDPSVVIYNNAFWVYVSKMILAFKRKQTASSIKYRDWSRQYSGYQDNDLKDYNFANANTPKIVLCIGGDTHWDILAKSTSADTPTKLDSGDSVASTELLQIVTGTDGVDRYYTDLSGNYLFPPVVAETTNEQAFDIVTLTKDAVYLTRIGAGDDRVIYLTNE